MDKIIHINVPDIHAVKYGDVYEFYNDELQFFINYLIDNDFDIITFAGDLFDDINSAEDIIVSMMLTFMKQVLEVASMRNAAVRAIKGTHSHDYDQLRMFDMFEERDEYDFKIINEVCEEEIFDGFWIRYIPEIPIKDEKVFSRNFDTEVDITVFHGLVEGAMPIAERRDDVYVDTRVPIISMEDLNRSTKHYTVGGHVHPRTFLNDYTWYTGSFSSGSYSDANEVKGFDRIILYPNDNRFNVEQIVNHNCYKFKTYDYTNKFTIKRREEIKVEILQMIRAKDYKTNIRIDVDSSQLNQSQKDNLEFIKVKFRDSIKFKIIEEDIETDREVLDAKLEEAGFILDKNISTEDKVMKVLVDNQDKFGLGDDEISMERLDDLMNMER